MASNPEIPSVIGRLLAELSWVGSTVRDYRNGGRGFENVLTAESLQALDLLPRTHFLEPVLACAHGATEARRALMHEAESVTFKLLPGDQYLRPSALSHQTRISVQPDAIMHSPSAYVVVEAKRLRRGSFQPMQLAREYVLALRQAQSRHPVLLLLPPEPPPVPVKGLGHKSITESIAMHMQEVIDNTDEPRPSAPAALERIDQVVCWITWQELLNVLIAQLRTLESLEPSIYASLVRIVGTVQAAIAWHSDG